MFGNFDFSILDSPKFKEDAVREELVVPILHRLGYSATGEHRINRSEPLVHPFVHIGTKEYKVNIIPDYLLAPAQKTEWVLDAKAPDEDIRKGKNVEQAYSYAIHKDVRVQLYALCNGRELVVFHISKEDPVLTVDLREIDKRWDEVNKVLSPLAFTNPAKLHFLPDFGLTVHRLDSDIGDTIFHFPFSGIDQVAKARDGLYTMTTSFELGRPYMASFDLDEATYKTMLSLINEKASAKIKAALSEFPYATHFIGDAPMINIGAKLTAKVIKNKSESFLPFQIVELSRCE